MQSTYSLVTVVRFHLKLAHSFFFKFRPSLFFSRLPLVEKYGLLTSKEDKR